MLFYANKVNRQYFGIGVGNLSKDFDEATERNKNEAKSKKIYAERFFISETDISTYWLPNYIDDNGNRIYNSKCERVRNGSLFSLNWEFIFPGGYTGKILSISFTPEDQMKQISFSIVNELDKFKNDNNEPKIDINVELLDSNNILMTSYNKTIYVEIGVPYGKEGKNVLKIPLVGGKATVNFRPKQRGMYTFPFTDEKVKFYFYGNSTYESGYLRVYKHNFFQIHIHEGYQPNP